MYLSMAIYINHKANPNSLYDDSIVYSSEQQLTHNGTQVDIPNNADLQITPSKKPITVPYIIPYTKPIVGYSSKQMNIMRQQILLLVNELFNLILSLMLVILIDGSITLPSFAMLKFKNPSCFFNNSFLFSLCVFCFVNILLCTCNRLYRVIIPDMI